MTELRIFMAAIQNSDPAPVSIDDGLQALELAEAVLLSAATGQPITLGQRP